MCTLPHLHPSKILSREIQGLNVLVWDFQSLIAGSVLLHMSQGGPVTYGILRHAHWRVLTAGAATAY